MSYPAAYVPQPSWQIQRPSHFETGVVMVPAQHYRPVPDGRRELNLPPSLSRRTPRTRFGNQKAPANPSPVALSPLCRSWTLPQQNGHRHSEGRTSHGFSYHPAMLESDPTPRAAPLTLAQGQGHRRPRPPPLLLAPTTHPTLVPVQRPASNSNPQTVFQSESDAVHTRGRTVARAAPGRRDSQPSRNRGVTMGYTHPGPGRQ
ncbi:hypothetical protein DFH08DRAFT_958751 [Mycena albidolilacea]|uniref:Uncharacterized protein n=1 Tax=Mycena albidolilacea TaxID=1033008 RepID=A0AAD7A5E7_9AGAR|nr:hypothetical protein DFH08DRAFT_958751 [Mycena albidolilacea]